MHCALAHTFYHERYFIMETIQACRRHHDDRREAITDLISSVAEEQEALARILEAEHKKIEKVTELSGVDTKDLVRIDRSVEGVLAAVTRLELALQLKLALFEDCLCPDDHHSEHCCQ